MKRRTWNTSSDKNFVDEEGENVLLEWEEEECRERKRVRLEVDSIRNAGKVDYLSLLWQLCPDAFVYITSILKEYTIKLVYLSKKYIELFKTRDWTNDIKQWFLSGYLPTDLAVKNIHPSDYNIFFIPGELHRYTVVKWDNKEKKFIVYMSNTSNKDNPFVSVTSFIEPLFPGFNADLIIGFMMKSRNWPNSKYYGMTPDEIKKLWKDKKDLASELGSIMHDNIEKYYNCHVYDDGTIEFTLFKEYEADLPKNLYPWKTEWKIYDIDDRLGRGLCMCGAMDMVYGFSDRPFDSQGRRRIRIMDWKRSEHVKMTDPYGKKGISSLTWNDPACNGSKYAYQGKTYGTIAERKYNCIVEGIDIVVLHPDQETYIMISVPFNGREFERIATFRLKELGLYEEEDDEDEDKDKEDNNTPSQQMLAR